MFWLVNQDENGVSWFALLEQVQQPLAQGGTLPRSGRAEEENGL